MPDHNPPQIQETKWFPFIHPFLGAASKAFLWFQRENKTKSVWVGEVQEHLIHFPAKLIWHAIPQWRHGWDFTQPGSFLLKKIEEKYTPPPTYKKNQPSPKKPPQNPKTTAPISMCPTEPLWTFCSIIFLLNQAEMCLGYLCLFAALPACRNLTWLLGGPWKTQSTMDAAGPVAQELAAVARAWFAPKWCWQQIQPWDPSSHYKVTPPPVVLPAATALLDVEDTPKKQRLPLMWSLLDMA